MLNNSFLSEQRSPVPPILLRSAIILCGIVPFLLLIRSDMKIGGIGVACAILASALAFASWNTSPSCPGRSTGSSLWMILMAAAFLTGLIGLFTQQSVTLANIIGLILLPMLVTLHVNSQANARTAKHIIVPVAFGSIFFFTSAALGVPLLGAFPAVIGALFVSVVRATLDIEEDIFENHGNSDHLEVEHHYRHRLAVTAVIFFLFGTVSLWPWLGEIYSKTYFWILLLGVLLPLAFFWGRIRQPKIEGAKIALIRFNRIAPVLGLMHIVALLAA